MTPHDDGSITRLHVGTTLSEVAIHRGTIYLAGQVADGASLDISGQTREVLGHIDRLLAEAGSDRQHILMCQIYLADLADYTAMNTVWNSWVVAGATPPRATVQAALANPAWRIEIVITAAQR